METDEIFNSKQAAEHVGVASKTIRRWIKRGKLPAEKVAGEFRIQKKDLMSAFLSAYNHRPVPPVRPEVDAVSTVPTWEQDQEKQAYAEATDTQPEPVDGQRQSPVPYPVQQVSVEDEPLVKELRSQIEKLEDKAETDKTAREEISFKLGQAAQENYQLKEKVKLLEAPPEQGKKRGHWWSFSKN